MSEFLWFLAGLVIGVVVTYIRQRGRIVKYRESIAALRDSMKRTDPKEAVENWLRDKLPFLD